MIKSHLHGSRFVPMVHFNNAKDQQQMHPVRSVLFTPGINERALIKGRNLDCDVLVMNLEDACELALVASFWPDEVDCLGLPTA